MIRFLLFILTLASLTGCVIASLIVGEPLIPGTAVLLSLLLVAVSIARLDRGERR